MPLEKQNVPVALQYGVDTKSDPKQVIIGKLISLVNGIFQTIKEIRKRFGFTALTTATQSGGNLSAGVSLATYNNELIELDGTSLNSFNASGPNWVNKGPLLNVSISTSTVIRSSTQQFVSDSALGGSLQAFAWNDSTLGIQYSIVDVVTGQSIVNNQTLFAAGELVRVLVVGSNFVFFYTDNATSTMISYKAVNISTPTTLGSQVTIITDLDPTTVAVDIASIGGNAKIAYAAVTPALALYSLSSSLALSAKYVVKASEQPESISVFGDGSNNIWVAFSDASNLQCAIVNSTMTANIQNATVLASITNGFAYIAGVVNGTTAQIFYQSDIGQNSNSSTYNTFISLTTFTLSGAVGTPFILNRGMGIASRAFIFNNVAYIYTRFPTVLQSLYFLIDQNDNVIAKFSQGDGGVDLRGLLPNVNVLNTGVYQTTVQIREQIADIVPTLFLNAGAFSKNGIQSIQTNFNGGWPSKINLGENLHYSGGYVHMYDGAKPVEHSYHIYPEGVTESSATSGGAVGVGSSTSTVNQIQYACTYEWVDNQGQLHESSPSIPVSVELPIVTPFTFTGTAVVNFAIVTAVSPVAGLFPGQVISNSNFPGGTYIVSVGSTTVVLSTIALASGAGSTFTTKDIGRNTVTIPTLRTTSKTNVNLVLYRTENNQPIFYRVGQIANDKTVDTLNIIDSTPDQAIISNQQLYTTGGEVENIAAPAISVATTFKNRMLVVPYENPLSWWYSKQTEQGVPVQFNDAFLENVDSRIGLITAIGTLDEKIVLFGPGSKYYVVGDGPAPNGANNDFTEAQRVAGVTGCQNQASLLEIPIGLIYQDPTKGIYLLDRSFQEQYIGADVEQYNSIAVTSAQVIPGQTIIRLTLANGLSLTYDYIVSQWGTDQYLSAAIDSTSQNEVFYYLTSNGTVQKEISGQYNDNGQIIPLGMTTGWMSFAQIEGFQRVYELQLLGEYKSPHTLTINTYVNYSSTPAQTTIIPVLAQPNIYQFRVRFNDQVQKCEAIQIQISESQQAPIGQGFSLSSLSFRVGIKTGLYKLPATASY